MLSVTVYLLAILAIANATLVEEFSCGRYYDVLRRFRNCLKEGGVSDFLGMLVTGGIIKGEEYLTELTAKCSNQEEGQRIEYCVESIVTDCPTLEQIIRATVQNKISFFCESNQPSSMITEVLQHGYMFNFACESGENPVYEIFGDCWLSATSEVHFTDVGNWSVSTALSTLGIMDQTVIECTLEQARDQLPNLFDCGSTGQDMLITYALRTSGIGYLDPTLPARTMEKIKDIITYKRVSNNAI